MSDDIDYDELTEKQKQFLKECALGLGYKIEGTTDEEVKEFYTRELKKDDEFKKRLLK